VALRDPLRDWEFGPAEWTITQSFAQHVVVADSTVTGIELRAADLLYGHVSCGVHQSNAMR